MKEGPHDDQWSRFSHNAEGGPMPPFVLESWARCRSFGLRTGQLSVPFVGHDEAASRVAAHQGLLDVASGHLRWLGAATAHLPFHCVMLTDATGVIIDSTGNLPEVMDQYGLRPGYDWSERAMGTNGIGTALAEGRPVAVIGPEHYLDIIHSYTCVGAPLSGPDGRLVGALDLCTTAADGDPSRLALVAYAAESIARELALREGAHVTTREQFAVLAHELMTPLSSISLLAQRLLRSTTADSAARVLAGRFDRQLKRLVSLTNDLLAFNEAAGPAEQNPPTALADLAHEVAADFREVAELTGRPVQVHAEDPLIARWDRRKLLRIATNLVSNAYKYGGTGPISILVERTDGAARLVVRDHGPGVPPDERARIFSRGVRGVDTRGASGSGLGLWIVSQLVDSMGGTIALADPPSPGAAFVVTVPFPER